MTFPPFPLCETRQKALCEGQADGYVLWVDDIGSFAKQTKEFLNIEKIHVQFLNVKNMGKY